MIYTNEHRIMRSHHSSANWLLVFLAAKVAWQPIGCYSCLPFCSLSTFKGLFNHKGNYSSDIVVVCVKRQISTIVCDQLQWCTHKPFSASKPAAIVAMQSHAVIIKGWFIKNWDNEWILSRPLRRIRQTSSLHFILKDTNGAASPHMFTTAYCLREKTSSCLSGCLNYVERGSGDLWEKVLRRSLHTVESIIISRAARALSSAVHQYCIALFCMNSARIES